MTFRFAARPEEPENGSCPELFMDRPSLQLYNGYVMDGFDRWHNGTPYFAGAGLTLEPQDFPEAPHLPHFLSSGTAPERSCRQIAEYRFGIRRKTP